jgi:hypothetical protein
MHSAGPGSNDDMRVWPANLPALARWLPYSPETARQSPVQLPQQLPQQMPARIDETQRRMKIPFWRLLLVASITAGFVGILGGTALGLLLGIH